MITRFAVGGGVLTYHDTDGPLNLNRTITERDFILDIKGKSEIRLPKGGTYNELGATVRKWDEPDYCKDGKCYNIEILENNASGNKVDRIDTTKNSKYIVKYIPHLDKTQFNLRTVIVDETMTTTKSTKKTIEKCSYNPKLNSSFDKNGNMLKDKIKEIWLNDIIKEKLKNSKAIKYKDEFDNFFKNRIITVHHLIFLVMKVKLMEDLY